MRRPSIFKVDSDSVFLRKRPTDDDAVAAFVLKFSKTFHQFENTDLRKGSSGLIVKGLNNKRLRRKLTRVSRGINQDPLGKIIKKLFYKISKNVNPSLELFSHYEPSEKSMKDPVSWFISQSK